MTNEFTIQGRDMQGQSEKSGTVPDVQGQLCFCATMGIILQCTPLDPPPPQVPGIVGPLRTSNYLCT